MSLGRVPIGSTVFWPSSVTIPAYWHEVDGAAISRTVYAGAFALFGTTFGSGDGTTTFNLPNAKGKLLCMYDTGFAVGSSRGASTVTLAEVNLPSHHHAQRITASQDAGIQTGTDSLTYNYTLNGNSANGAIQTHDTGSGTAFSIVPPELGYNLIMYIGGEDEETPTLEESNALIANAIEYLSGILSYLLGNQG